MGVYFIGVDLGTSGIKAGIMDEVGTILAQEYWDTELVFSGPDRMEQNPDFFYEKTLQIIKEAKEKAGVHASDIAGLAIDGQMGGIVGIDRNFCSVTGLDMGLDIRSEKYNSEIQREYGDVLAETTFGSPRNAPKMMMWAKEYPDVYAKVYKFITLSGYVTGKIAGLSGDDAFIDYTLLSFFGNEDARKLCWSKDLTRAFKLDLEKLPRIVNPWDVIGNLTKEAARKSQLKAGMPVTAGAGDQPANLLGAGFIEPGQLLDVSGSTTLLFASVDSFIPDTDRQIVMYMPSIVKGKYSAFTYINGGGLTLKWFRDEFAVGSSWDELDSKAKQLKPGCDGLLFIPYLGGRQCPYDAGFRGSWIGMNWGHKKEHLYRAILEGLAYDYLLGLERIRSLFPNFRDVSIDGTGGGTKSHFWNQIKADVLNIPYRKLGDYQFTLRGCGIIVGYSLGIYTDLGETAKLFHSGDENSAVKPDLETADIYKRYYNIFRKVFSSPLDTTMGRLSSTVGEYNIRNKTWLDRTVK